MLHVQLFVAGRELRHFTVGLDRALLGHQVLGEIRLDFHKQRFDVFDEVKKAHNARLAAFLGNSVVAFRVDVSHCLYTVVDLLSGHRHQTTKTLVDCTLRS